MQFRIWLILLVAATNFVSSTKAQISDEVVKIGVLNDQSGAYSDTAGIGSVIANRWIDTEKVDAIVDVPTSSIALAVQEITRN